MPLSEADVRRIVQQEVSRRITKSQAPIGIPLVTGDIQDSAVTTAKLNDLAVTAAKLAANAVTTAKILDANVTTDKLAAGVLPALRIGSGSSSSGVTGTEIITLTASAGKTFVYFLITAHPHTTSGGIRVILTYSDSTVSEAISFGAGTGVQLIDRVGRARVDAVDAPTAWADQAKAVSQINVETFDAGGGSRQAKIVALEA